MAESEPPPRPVDEGSDHEDDREEALESDPLLSNPAQDEDELDEQDEQDQSPRKSSFWGLWPRKQRQVASTGGRKWRWPSVIAIILLAGLIIVIMVLGFLLPPAVKQYAEKGAVIEPTSLSIESLTADGVRARIQANFRVDASRVHNDQSRRLGKAATNIIRKLHSDETKVDVYLPQYDNILAGTAVVPPMSLDIVHGHNNAIDIVADLLPGNPENIRMIANEWLGGKIDQLKVTGSANLRLKAGILPLGTHSVRESWVFEADDVPTIPDYEIRRLSFHDIPIDANGTQAIAGDATLALFNNFTVSLDAPSLAFEVLVPDCDDSQTYILVAEAITKTIEVRPHSNVSADAKAVIREIPDALVKDCPMSESSPLDHFMERYLHGEDATILVRGKKGNDSDTPDWIDDIINGITVPIDFPGRSFGDFIRNFSLDDVHFKLPSPFADPGDPNAVPRVSGTVEVLAALPDELNLHLGVNKMRADADLFYEQRKLGELNLDHWQKANSSKILGAEEDMLNITSNVVNAPINITNGDVFSDLMQKMLFGGEEILLDIKAAVDVMVVTVLGEITVKKVPSHGKIPVKPLSRDAAADFEPKVSDLQILKTTSTGVHLQTVINCTNPTPYTADIPYANLHVFENETRVGEVMVRNLRAQLGNNTNITVQAVWDPLTFGGEDGQEIGRRLLSEYLSGKNTTITVRTHRESVPGMPLIGEALSSLNLTIPTPRFKLPGDDEDGAGGFIRATDFHIFSSTATFLLASPLRHNIIYLNHISAKAFYNHTEPVGSIIYDQPFPATPGFSRTPRLPVKWSSGSVGYDKLRAALGGRLKLDALANVTIRLGEWNETVHYEGKGIGTNVHL